MNTEHRGAENVMGAIFPDGGLLLKGNTRTELVIEILRQLAITMQHKLLARSTSVMLPGVPHPSHHWDRNVGYLISVIDDKAGTFKLTAYRTRECGCSGGYVYDTGRIRGAATIARLNDKVLIEKRTGIFADIVVTSELRRLLPNVLLERPSRPKLVAVLYKNGQPAYLTTSNSISAAERAKYANQYDYVEVPQQD